MDSFSVFRRALGRSQVMLVVFGLSSVSCGNTVYALKVSSAAGKLEHAETIGAEEKAPYEYYSASVRLAEARNLAARAEYGDAWRLAKEAEQYADRAIRKAERAPTSKAPPPFGPTQPAAAQPGTAQPAAAQPGTAQPAAAQPGTAEPAQSSEMQVTP